ncbi:DUF3606 domain-containing protein [Pendulispora rubella]|uniref:DUF3606 domain-containing protein n=1 Tax=Pendulispora rubella TaxID=2741070 RepID=A0ABZ2LD21_9BACT
MSDDKSKVGMPDRFRVAAEEKWEVDYLVKKFGVSVDDVRRAVAKVGNSRSAVEAELVRLKGQPRDPATGASLR